MIEGLRRVGVEVIECHEPLWHGIKDRVNTVKSGWKQPRFWGRLIKTYYRLIKKITTLPPFDVMVVGYPGQLDVFLARLISWFKKKPLVWDIFMSIYLISIERGLDRNSKLAVTLLRWVEKAACFLPDFLIIDTPEYRQWFHQTYVVPIERFGLVPTGADNLTYLSQPGRNKSIKFTVVYYGSFIPNHGTIKIVEAAKILREMPEIYFEFIGDGPEKKEAMQLAEKYQLQNISFAEWMDREELVGYILDAAVCLGAFGSTPQSLMTIQNKIYEGMAIAKPVLTGESPAVLRVFTHQENIMLCQRTPEGIAYGIRTLYEQPDLCARLSREGHNLFLKEYTMEKLGEKFKEHLDCLLAKRR